MPRPPDYGDAFQGVSGDRAENARENAESQRAAQAETLAWIPQGPAMDPLASLRPRAIISRLGSSLDVGVPFIPTGWKRIDEKVGGLAVPSLNVLGAAPKSGKSTWSQVIAFRHVLGGGVAYHLDIENGDRRYFRRINCRVTEIGQAEIREAFKNPKDPLAAEKIKRWNEAKEAIAQRCARLHAEFRPLKEAELEFRLKQIRAEEPTRRFLIIVDSLQKLPGDFEDRRSTIDKWIRLFERLRYELDAAILVISEIRRGPKGEYTAHEAAFKESGGIEYAADLAMTLTRPRADEKKKEAIATLRVELARDSDNDPRGNVAAYRPLYPYYGLEELDPPAKGKGGSDDDVGVTDWLLDRLADGPVKPGTLIEEGAKIGIGRTVLYDAKKTLKIKSDSRGWRLP